MQDSWCDYNQILKMHNTVCEVLSEVIMEDLWCDILIKLRNCMIYLVCKTYYLYNFLV